MHPAPSQKADSVHTLSERRRHYGHKHQPTCSVVPRGKTYTGKQAFTYFAGISAENTGSHGICMHLLIILPGERAKAHLHERHETAIYVVSSQASLLEQSQGTTQVCGRDSRCAHTDGMDRQCFPSYKLDNGSCGNFVPRSASHGTCVLAILFCHSFCRQVLGFL